MSNLAHTPAPTHYARFMSTMVNRFLELLRRYPLLKLLLFFHSMAIAALAAFYYMQADEVL